MYEIHSNKYHVSSLQYHITFFTKNDRSLESEEETFIKNYFQTVSTRHEFKILKIDIQKCEVKLIINCKTTHYIPNIVKALKGGSARFLYKEFPDLKLKHGNSLWDQRYFITTEDNRLDMMVREYRHEY